MKMRVSFESDLSIAYNTRVSVLLIQFMKNSPSDSSEKCRWQPLFIRYDRGEPWLAKVNNCSTVLVSTAPRARLPTKK